MSVSTRLVLFYIALVTTLCAVASPLSISARLVHRSAPVGVAQIGSQSTAPSLGGIQASLPVYAAPGSITDHPPSYENFCIAAPTTYSSLTARALVDGSSDLVETTFVDNGGATWSIALLRFYINSPWKVANDHSRGKDYEHWSMLFYPENHQNTVGPGLQLEAAMPKRNNPGLVLQKNARKLSGPFIQVVGTSEATVLLEGLTTAQAEKMYIAGWDAACMTNPPGEENCVDCLYQAVIGMQTNGGMPQAALNKFSEIYHAFEKTIRSQVEGAWLPPAQAKALELEKERAGT